MGAAEQPDHAPLVESEDLGFVEDLDAPSAMPSASSGSYHHTDPERSLALDGPGDIPELIRRSHAHIAGPPPPHVSATDRRSRLGTPRIASVGRVDRGVTLAYGSGQVRR